MSEHEQASSAAERLAEVMAWHGMARYADPDVLAAYVGRATSRGEDVDAGPDEAAGSSRTARSPR